MMYTEEELNLIILSSFDELTYRLKRFLLSDFQSAAPDFEKRKDLLIKTLTDGVYNKVKANFYDVAYRTKILNGLENRGVKCVTCFSEEYPENLKNIFDPPITLYCKGDISLLKTDCFSVVGSRKSTAKMKEDCREISGKLTSQFTVVSGLAEGADTAALEGALDSGGKVISVLPNGFDKVYPAVNAPLLERVIKQGLAITEYTPQTKCVSYRFYPRNRIIAGLSRGTLVVSAGERSGALITAEFANDYGRDVFAFPHSLGVYLGRGCNGLIKNGAYPVENILDIFQKYGLDLKKPEEKKLSYDESAVYEALQFFGEAHLSEIAANTGRKPVEVIALLSSLEIKNLAKNLGGNRYCAIK